MVRVSNDRASGPHRLVRGAAARPIHLGVDEVRDDRRHAGRADRRRRWASVRPRSQSRTERAADRRSVASRSHAALFAPAQRPRTGGKGGFPPWHTGRGPARLGPQSPTEAGRCCIHRRLAAAPGSRPFCRDAVRACWPRRFSAPAAAASSGRWLSTPTARSTSWAAEASPARTSTPTTVPGCGAGRKRLRRPQARRR